MYRDASYDERYTRYVRLHTRCPGIRQAQGDGCPGVYHAELRGGCPPSLPPSLVKPTAATIRRLCLRPVTWWEPEHHRRRPLPRLPTTHTTTHKSQSAQSASVHYPRYGSAEEESSTHSSAASRPQDSPIWNHSLATAVFCMSFPCMRAFDFLQLIIFPTSGGFYQLSSEEGTTWMR